MHEVSKIAHYQVKNINETGNNQAQIGTDGLGLILSGIARGKQLS